MQAADLPQHAIDAVADTQEILFRLEVDVRRAALDRVGEQRGDQAHHRLGIGVAGGLQALVVDLAGLDLVQDAVDRELVAVELVDELVELGLARGKKLHDKRASLRERESRREMEKESRARSRE